ncbi:nucleoside triphosphate pyrophosphohydrolase [Salipaludibacillus aurantiacus]|uniref:Tetrapyrrole methylase family protein / MazG family protein n=1 Tax=Salipaludibacillus aurantiacus TaxID=1601833 RepID=A0A1H9X4M4_9BACI|nr:nucleoside triphosphate pyrophosphohydrolase [Salipaludibacillus aurantiacus]SES40817.1 tetrapyrrole methylase family protein / MazG family protein [Salipaludibacillus aurantiacus]
MTPAIHIIGLGAGDLAQLPLGIYRKLQASGEVFVRTEKHPVIQELIEEGMTFQSFDFVYEAHEQFEDVYREIVQKLLDEVKDRGTVTYAVPGHPMVAEATVQQLLREKGEIEVKVEGGQSFLDAMFNALKIDPVEGFQLVDGLQMRPEDLVLTQHIIVGQVYDSMSASAVKLSLMERLPDDYPVAVVTAAGTADESVVHVPLYELDRVAELSNLTAVYIPPVESETLLYRDFSKLRSIIRQLRGPEGCPWDKKQTHESLKRYLIEEAYELLEAIDEKDDDHLTEELGDVLLQVLLHAQIGEDEGFFNMEDVIERLNEKMVRRHPHVFGTVQAENAEEVTANWEDIKKQEKKENGRAEDEITSLLDGIPASFPSLLKAYKLQKKAAKAGFDWGDEAPMWMKLQEEIAEWLHALKEGSYESAVEELGDILFAFVNLARYHKIDPEEALRQTNNKFERRFRYIEQALNKQGKAPENQSLEELDALWEEAKEKE